MKNILVPTDLSIRSLSYLHNLAENHNDMLNITLMHALRLPDSILDFWVFSKSTRHHALVSNEFREACEVMKNKYATVINSLQVEFFYGTTAPALRNFLKAHEISEIALPEGFYYQLPCTESYNPQRLFSKCRLPVSPLKMTAPKQVITASTSISELLVVPH
ncbi:hypothetical protein [Chitinophaga cymbidii]|uniref:UspA domain-containing protein n=1 Tax=Chitinophaga cymbidii TaxID=1096750 RepID=A0A512RRT8_9BACT|nr:hypothetical protein [Chitinophaga cymbidii]GEP98413.1 hypothetical protein CCY01nite_46730 [Chitinophaga cymbidii]